MRKGELIALKWGDIQFGEDPEDLNRYILVQPNYSQGRFTSPKSKKSRRVDLSKHLRNVLLELRDKRMLEAFISGQTSIADDLVFPSQAGTVIKPDNIVPRYMEPALEKAGLRRFRFHDCRYTFGSLLIQDGASLAYVRDQMGHSSIQITVDTYGHPIPGANIAWVDRLDSETSLHQSAPEAHQPRKISEAESVEVVEKTWLPPRDSNPYMLIQSYTILGNDELATPCEFNYLQKPGPHGSTVAQVSKSPAFTRIGSKRMARFRAQFVCTRSGAFSILDMLTADQHFGRQMDFFGRTYRTKSATALSSETCECRFHRTHFFGCIACVNDVSGLARESGSRPLSWHPRGLVLSSGCRHFPTPPQPSPLASRITDGTEREKIASGV